MSVSPDSETPMLLSCSSRWTRSSSALGTSSEKRMPTVLSVKAVLMRRPVGPLFACPLLDADGAHFLHVRHAGETFLHPVLFQGAHAVLEALRQHLGHARVLLNQFLQLVGGDQQLV